MSALGMWSQEEFKDVLSYKESLRNVWAIGHPVQGGKIETLCLRTEEGNGCAINIFKLG